MRYAIVSDIHANLEALEVVLEDLALRECDRVICLGDFVGYGPSPNECVDRVRPLLGGRAVAGNHDWAAVGKVDISFFNIYAQQAILWTQQALRPDVGDFLTALPQEWSVGAAADGGFPFLAVHGSPRDPVEEYVLDGATAAENFNERSFGTCFIGHSHVPGIFVAPPGDGGRRNDVEVRTFVPGVPTPLDPQSRYLINVGSVGQPRDGDPRAAYTVLETDAREVMLIRIEYPIPRTQARMREEGLPPVLAERLSLGR